MPARLNPFRAQLAALPNPGPEKGARRAAFFRALPIAAKALFLDESPIDFRMLIATAAPWSGADAMNMNLYESMKPLVASGRILTSRSARSGSGTSPYALDLASAEPFSTMPTLRDVIASFIREPHSSTAVASLFAAARTLMALPSHARRHDVLAAAEALTARQLHALPAQLRRRAASDGSLNRKTLANYASSIRSLLCYGLAGDLFPLFFPIAAETDPCAWLVNATFPRYTDAPLTQSEKGARSGLAAILRVARAEGLQVDGEQPTPFQAVEALRRLGSPLYRRERNLVGQLRTALVRGVPHTAHPFARPFLDVVIGTGRKAALPYLGGQNHAGAASNVASLSSLLAAEGLSSEWHEFLVWYHDFSTLEWRTLLSRAGDFPARPASGRLASHSFHKRLAVVRALLGILKEREPCAFLTCTPEQVFGPRLRALLSDALARWSHAAGREGGPSHAASGGIQDIADGASLIARALFERSLHRRGLVAAGEDAPAQGTARAPSPGALTPPELALWEAARFARSVATNLASERKEATSVTGNTVKDLSRAVSDTPVAHFVIAQLRLLGEVATLPKELNKLHDADRTLVVGTFVNGVLLSTAMRLEEVCHLRLGIHVSSSPWIVRTGSLRPTDRKNGVANSFSLSPRFLPDWFLRYYLQMSRFVATDKNSAAVAGQHPWLVFAPSTGLPFGCAEESIDGSGRDYVALASRKGALRDLWQDVVAAAFKRSQLAVPHESRQFGPHIVRGVLGHAVYQKFGLKAAANLLGDSEAVVERHYRLLAGAHVDTSDIDEELGVGRVEGGKS